MRRLSKGREVANPRLRTMSGRYTVETGEINVPLREAIVLEITGNWITMQVQILMRETMEYNVG